MNEEEKIAFQKQYEQLSDEGLLELAETDSLEFQEGVYKIILEEVKKRKLEGELNKRQKLKEEQEKARIILKKKQKEASKIDLDFVPIKQFSYRHEAEFAKQILVNQGIEANVLADDCGGLRPHLPIGMGGIQLLVKRVDLEKAKVILEDNEKN